MLSNILYRKCQYMCECDVHDEVSRACDVTSDARTRMREMSECANVNVSEKRRIRIRIGVHAECLTRIASRQMTKCFK